MKAAVPTRRLGNCLKTVTLAAVVGAVAACPPPPPDLDPVAKGEQIFFNETFEGNGRTCLLQRDVRRKRAHLWHVSPG